MMTTWTGPQQNNFVRRLGGTRTCSRQHVWKVKWQICSETIGGESQCDPCFCDSALKLRVNGTFWAKHKTCWVLPAWIFSWMFQGQSVTPALKKRCALQNTAEEFKRELFCVPSIITGERQDGTTTRHLGGGSQAKTMPRGQQVKKFLHDF